MCPCSFPGASVSSAPLLAHPGPLATSVMPAESLSPEHSSPSLHISLPPLLLCSKATCSVRPLGPSQLPRAWRAFPSYLSPSSTLFNFPTSQISCLSARSQNGSSPRGQGDRVCLVHSRTPSAWNGAWHLKVLGKSFGQMDECAEGPLGISEHTLLLGNLSRPSGL